MTLQKQFQVKERFVYGSIGISPDGSLLATGSSAGGVALWDPRTAELLWDAGHHDGYAYNITFGFDNRTLVSGGQDGTCYVWDLRHARQPLERDLNKLWKELGGDGKTSYQAMSDMMKQPDHVTGFVGDKLRPVTRVMNLEEIVKGLPDDEAARRRRLTQVLADKDETVLLSEVARRSVSLLREVGTPEAIALLKELAGRDTNGELGKLAAGALERMAASRSTNR